MLKKLALVIALAGLLPGAALAHGPTRQKVTESVEINSPADKVWAAVGNFPDMGWTGIATQTERTGDNTVAATRQLPGTMPRGTPRPRRNWSGRRIRQSRSVSGVAIGMAR